MSAATVLVAPSLIAQGKPKEEQDVVIPESAIPPAGMCRVWLRDVPERQQPAPTDCATALRTRPRNSILLFGDLSQEAVQPPARRLMSPANASSRSLFDDPRGRRLGFQAVDTRILTGTMTPAQAMQAAEAAGRKAPAGPVATKAEPTKAAIKPPDERP